MKIGVIIFHVKANSLFSLAFLFLFRCLFYDGWKQLIIRKILSVSFIQRLSAKRMNYQPERTYDSRNKFGKLRNYSGKFALSLFLLGICWVFAWVYKLPELNHIFHNN